MLLQLSKSRSLMALGDFLLARPIQSHAAAAEKFLGFEIRFKHVWVVVLRVVSQRGS